MSLRSSILRLGASWTVAVALLVTVGCEEPRDAATVSGDILALQADFIVFGGEQFMSREGQREAHIVYDTAFQWIDSTAVALRRLTLKVYNEDGTERATVTADRGTLDQATDRMVAHGNVVLVIPGDEGRTIMSEELHYDPDGGMIWSDSAFVMRTRSATGAVRELRGSRFSSDLEFRNFQAWGPGSS